MTLLAAMNFSHLQVVCNTMPEMCASPYFHCAKTLHAHFQQCSRNHFPQCGTQPLSCTQLGGSLIYHHVFRFILVMALGFDLFNSANATFWYAPLPSFLVPPSGIWMQGTYRSSLKSGRTICSLVLYAITICFRGLICFSEHIWDKALDQLIT